MCDLRKIHVYNTSLACIGVAAAAAAAAASVVYGNETELKGYYYLKASLVLYITWYSRLKQTATLLSRASSFG